MSSPNQIYMASRGDLDALLRLENLAFASDRFTEEQIEYLVTHAHASVFVLKRDGRAAAAAYVLWRRSLLKGRLYNIATDPVYRGQGLGKILMRECELEAARRRCTHITLEVRVDNASAIGFYEKLGYKSLSTVNDYYEDGAPALKMVKHLKRKVPDSVRRKVPYYAQSLDFTCGPASLMMAVAHFIPKTELTRTLELNLWKEATLVFMTSGFGGTGPYGLALAARRRGLEVRVVLSSEKTPFENSVRIPAKREVIRLVNEDLKRRAIGAGVAASYYNYSVEDVFSAIYRGYIPIVLISTYRLTGDRVPHWVVVTGFDKSHVYIHDPDEDSYHKRRYRARNLKVEHAEFIRMSRYGKDVFRSAIMIGAPCEE